MTFFIPRFSRIFAEFGSALPMLTRVIVGASQWVTSYGLVFVGVLMILFLVGRRALASEAGRRAVEWLMLKTPGLGGIVSRFAVVRFCRMLGTLLGAGVPLVAALRVAREAIGYQTLRTPSARRSKKSSAASRSRAAWPPARSCSRPRSRRWWPSRRKAAGSTRNSCGWPTSYEVLLDRQLRMLVSLVEPALLFIMAGIVGTIIIGMLLPVFTLQELIQ